MNLSVLGHIYVSDVNCLKCDKAIQHIKMSFNIKCTNCGAAYSMLSDPTVVDSEAHCTYKFDGFQCLHTSFASSNKCINTCPTSSMFCKLHSTEDDLANAEKAILFAQNNLQRLEETLNKIIESRRIWLIEDLSGLNEERETTEE